MNEDINTPFQDAGDSRGMERLHDLVPSMFAAAPGAMGCQAGENVFSHFCNCLCSRENLFMVEQVQLGPALIHSVPESFQIGPSLPAFPFSLCSCNRPSLSPSASPICQGKKWLFLMETLQPTKSHSPFCSHASLALLEIEMVAASSGLVSHLQ